MIFKTFFVSLAFDWSIFMKHKFIFCDCPSPSLRSASWLIYIRFCYELSAAICRGNLPWLSAVAICRGNLPWLFAVGICRGYLPWEFAVAICRGNLPWQFCRGNLPWGLFVYVSKPFFFVSKSFFFVKKPFIYGKKTFFLFMRVFLLTVYLFAIALAVIGHHTFAFSKKRHTYFLA